MAVGSWTEGETAREGERKRGGPAVEMLSARCSVGGLDEVLAAVGELAAAREDLLDLGVFHHAPEAVGAEQEDVALAELLAADVGLGVGRRADGAGDDVVPA